MHKRVDIWHGILWSKYRGAVFSHLHALTADEPVELRFYQVCETRADRAATPVDLAYHTYPYTLLFSGDYNKIPKAALYWRLLRETMRSPADLVLLAGYGFAENWVQLIAAKLSGKDVGVFCDSTLSDHRQSAAKSLLKRIFFSACRLAFCYGQRSADLALRYGVPPGQVVHPVAAASLPLGYRSDDIVSLRQGRASPNARFLFVGRLSPEKNLERLLAAFAEVRRQIPSAVLRLVGDGPQERMLRAAAANLGVDGAVEFAGSRTGEDLYGEYLQSTCLVLPSTREPWGLVANEALSYGCPVVVSDVCGCVPELVVEGETGFVVPAGDTAAIASALIEAVTRFADVKATAERCLDQVAPFTPSRAAETIYRGLSAV